ncbi:MAG: hypothetical protein FJ096_00145 [Deltaproteobacteria bacterium]|nr:hypothetical protein [Deltaproteobacteria bacterium]
MTLRRVKVALLVFASILIAPGPTQGADRRPPSLDRTVVRWALRSASQDGRPRFILARELAFEARIEAMSEGRKFAQAYTDSHVRAAIQRHITEEILAELPVDPAPAPRDVGRYAEDARRAIEQQVGGRAQLNLAASAEGITAEELNALLRRRARATYYLDKMVAPMLQPSESDLREVHRRGDTPFTASPFEEVEESIRSWYVSARLRAALDSYYRSVRTKVMVELIGWRG